MSFLTLVSLVPILVAVAFELQFLFRLPNFRERITEILSAYVLPETSRAITSYLESTLESSRTLGVMGIVFALLVSFLLLFAFSKVVNRIWRVGARHSSLRTAVKFVALSLAVPAMVGSTAALNNISIMDRLPMDVLSGLFRRPVTSQLMSLLLDWLLFTVMLGFIPNGRVRFSYALVTGVITGTCWFFLRRGLDLYVKFFPQISVLYGSLAFIPIFLIYVYLSWLIVLFGVELNYTLHEDRGSLQIAGG